MSLSGLELVGLILVAWTLLLAPGYCLLSLLEIGLQGDDRNRQIVSGIATRAAVSMALTISLIPIAWMAVTVVGLTVSPFITSAVTLTLGTVAATWVLLKNPVITGRRRVALKRDSLPEVALVLILVVSLVVRLQAIEGLAFPAWVDSPHHDLIIRLLALHGRVPTGYEPLLPVSTFTYHFGFHVLAVTYIWLTNLANADALLILSQILNGLVPLGAFAFARLTTRRSWIAVTAAAIVGLVSLFPGYYVSWGRSTQLAGLIVLAPLLALLADSVADKGLSTGPRQCRLAVLIGVLSAGLIYTHYRVVAFAGTFLLTILIVYRRPRWRLWSLAGVITLVLASPWLQRLIGAWIVPHISDPTIYLAPGNYNDFPWNYFNGTLERAWWIVVAVGTVIGFIRRDRVTFLMTVWIGATVALLNIPGAGSWVVNNNSWAISVFLPGSAIAGYALVQGVLLTGWLWQKSPIQGSTGPIYAKRGMAIVLAFGLGTMATAGLAYGTVAQARILNSRTVLALPADRQAMAWLRANLPQNAMIVVNSWYWQNDIWSASDGGIWIWTETGRATTTPPLDYTYEPAWAARVNDWNARWAAVKALNTPEAIALLREVGATHLYLGAVPGHVTPEMAAAAPEIYELIYEHEEVRVYSIALP